MPAFAALLGCWMLNAFWPLIGQDGLRCFSAALFYHGAMAVGFLCFLPALLARGRWRRALRPGVAGPLFLMSLLSGTGSLIYLMALRYTTAANAAVMAQSEVLYSAILSTWMLGESVLAPQGVASLMVLAGTGLIMAHDLGSLRWKGDLMIVLTPWMFQISHVIAKRLPKDLDPILVSGGRLFFSLFALAPFSLWALRHDPNWSWSAPALRVLVWQGVFMNALSVFFWYGAIRRIDLSKATAFLLSYPALTMLLSWCLGQERIAVAQLGGLAITMAGAYWLSRLARAPRGSSGTVRTT